MAVQPEKAVYDYVIDQSQLLFFVLEPDGQIIDANAFAKTTTGCRPGKDTFQALLVGNHDGIDLEQLAENLQTDHLMTLNQPKGFPTTYYFHFIRLGTAILALGRQDAQEMESLQKELVGLNQELNNMTRELHQKNARLVQLNREKNQFLGMAAHDLRKPIGLILTYSEFLAEEGMPLLTDQLKDFLETIHGSSLFMKKLVDDFLDVSAIEAGRFDMDFQLADLSAVLDQSLKLGRLQAVKKGVDLQVQIAENLPELHIDVSKIEQAIMNLVGNAIEYSLEGSTVTVRLSRCQDTLCLLVQDRGQGIPAEELDRLFKPFGKTSTQKTGGEKSTGLGMLITQKIIMAHKGEIKVDSSPGHGTRISVNLPIRKSKAV